VKTEDTLEESLDNHYPETFLHRYENDEHEDIINSTEDLYPIPSKLGKSDPNYWEKNPIIITNKTKLGTISKSSSFTNGGKREYHTDISEHLEDLNHLSTPRFEKNKFKNKDKFKKTSNKN
jgi:hypothetical protein